MLWYVTISLHPQIHLQPGSFDDAISRCSAVVSEVAYEVALCQHLFILKDPSFFKTGHLYVFTPFLALAFPDPHSKPVPGISPSGQGEGGCCGSCYPGYETCTSLPVSPQRGLAELMPKFGHLLKQIPFLHSMCVHSQSLYLIRTILAFKCNWYHKLPECMLRFVEVTLCA